jgi:hypothetical protein
MDRGASIMEVSASNRLFENRCRGSPALELLKRYRIMILPISERDADSRRYHSRHDLAVAPDR